MNSFGVMCGCIIISMAVWVNCPAVKEALAIGGIPLLVYIFGLMGAVAFPALMNKKGVK